MPNLVKQVAGQLTQETTVSTSAGAASVGKVPELGAGGILDDTILNAATTGAGKLLKLDGAGKVTTSTLNAVNASTGATDAGKVLLLDPSGRIDPSAMPVGNGADVQTITASEALAAGDYVNVHDGGAGTFRARKADASTTGKEAVGFVLTAVASGAAATVYFEGTNTAVTGQTPGKVFLSPTQPGKGTATVPSGAGQIIQNIGFATSATTVNFNAGFSLAL